MSAGADIDMEDTWKTFFVIASNYSTGSETVLSRGNLARNVIASYAIPGAMPPAFIDGHMMYDGGTFNNFPVDVMAQLDRTPNGMTLGELSARMMVSNGNVTGLVERLVQQGLLDRRPSPSDSAGA